MTDCTAQACAPPATCVLHRLRAHPCPRADGSGEAARLPWQQSLAVDSFVSVAGPRRALERVLGK